MAFAPHNAGLIYMMKLARRSFLISCSSVVPAVPLLLAGNSHALARKANKSKTTTKDEWTAISKEEWMAEVLKKRRTAHSKSKQTPIDRGMAASKDPLFFGRFRDPWYYLTRPISWSPNPDQVNFQKVEVPLGFVIDLASIPQIFYSLLPRDGEYAYAAIIHDYLYWTQDRPRTVSDEILKFSMEDFKVSSWKIQAIYTAVRILGEDAWNENARLKTGGDRRILKSFPPTAQINWTDWKQQSDVFSD
jgi:hypothetical protein